MMVVGTPLDDGEEMVGEAVDEGISVIIALVMNSVLDGER